MHRQDPITSHQNERVKQLRAAFAGLSRTNRIAVEGPHLVAEALRSGASNPTLFLTESFDPARLPISIPRAVERVLLSDEVFDRAVLTDSPQGIALLFTPAAQPPRSGTELVLVACALQDPGNFGTLIRSAEAFAATAILALKGTVSPWNQKVLRASAGSALRMPIALGASVDDVAELRRRGLRILAAVARNGSPYYAADLAAPCAILIGNEGAGLAPELLELADELLTIPIPGAVESLNAAVAGSLLLAEAARQRAASTPVRAKSAPRKKQ